MLKPSGDHLHLPSLQSILHNLHTHTKSNVHSNVHMHSATCLLVFFDSD